MIGSFLWFLQWFLAGAITYGLFYYEIQIVVDVLELYLKTAERKIKIFINWTLNKLYALFWGLYGLSQDWPWVTSLIILLMLFTGLDFICSLY